MKLRQFAKEYGLNVRTENLLWKLKWHADQGHIKDERVSKFYDNNIEKVLIIAVKDQFRHEEWLKSRVPYSKEYKTSMLYLCPGIGRITVTNIVESVYAYLDDPSTPDNKETTHLLLASTPLRSKRTDSDKSVNYISFEMDLDGYCRKEDDTQHMTYTVTSHTNKKYADSHCTIVLDKCFGEREQVIVEEMPLTQLKRLYDFIGMVFKLDR